ncbi:MAG: class I SAM-dependent methyltransferase [Burkholderiales bacterium]
MQAGTTPAAIRNAFEIAERPAGERQVILRKSGVGIVPIFVRGERMRVHAAATKYHAGNESIASGACAPHLYPVYGAGRALRLADTRMPAISKRSGRDERAALFPAELLPQFDDSFITSFELFEEYVARLSLQAFGSTGLSQACRQDATAEQAIARAELAPEIARVPATWLLEMLAWAGWLDRSAGADGQTRYRTGSLPELDPDEILARQRAHDPRCLPCYEIAALAAAHYPAVLRGTISGEQALFGPEGIIPWVKYFSNDNPLYAVSNAVGAISAARNLPDGACAILEIGGGLGSGADTLLQQLERTNRAADIDVYHLTDISPLFLKRARRELTARHPACPFRFTVLDIDRAFAGSEVVPGNYALAYGVNVLHVARDLAATLHELRNALCEHGVLVMSEYIRPFPGKPLHLELVFNLLTAFREPVLHPDWRPNGGFLTPEQWTAALQANGFADVRIFPDIAAIRDAYPEFAIATIVARRA